MSETHTYAPSTAPGSVLAWPPGFYAGKPEKARAWFEEDEDEDALPEQAEEAA